MLFRSMIDNGVNMDVPNFYKWKPIHILCKRPNSDILRYVIERCGGIEETTCEGLKPIHILCEHSILNIIRFFIENNRGVNLEAVDNFGWKPIHYACKYSTPETIEYLVEQGVNIKKCETNDGWIPLYLVCKYSTCDIILYMIDLTMWFDKKKVMKLIKENNNLTKEERYMINHLLQSRVNFCVVF